jgi:hypothetical protein
MKLQEVKSGQRVRLLECETVAVLLYRNECRARVRLITDDVVSINPRNGAPAVSFRRPVEENWSPGTEVEIV